MHPSNCPDCGISWYSDYSMPDELMVYYPDKTGEQIEDIARGYGWTEENDLRFGKNVIGIEYDNDRIEEWYCRNCGYTEQRK